MSIETYKVLDKETIYDIAIKLYGNVATTIKLCSDNNIGLDSVLNGGDTLIWDTIYRLIIPAQIDATPTTPPIYGYYTGQYGQTIYDVCLITYGKYELLTRLCEDNGIDLNTISANGITFKYELNLVNDRKLFAYLQQLGTGVGGTEYIIPTPPLPTTDYLLLEDGFYLLQENNDKFIL